MNRQAIIFCTRQKSEDFDLLKSDNPTDAELFAQFRKEFELEFRLLHVNIDRSSKDDEYQIVVAHNTQRSLAELRDRLQLEYDQGAAGQFMIVAFAQDVEATAVPRG